MMGTVRRWGNRLRRELDIRREASRLGPLPHEHQPVFILGHQKAGTSAIAGLLGQYCGLAATIDLQQEIRDLLIPKIVRGQATIEQLIARNRSAFAAPIVKHPNLTLIVPQLRARFPESPLVFVVRDPRDNIRSILDRLRLPGDAPAIDDVAWDALPRPWRLILGEENPGLARTRYLEALADRWTVMARAYLDEPSAMHLIRYEDFASDKETAIARLAEALGLKPEGDIAGSLDHAFQRPGRHQGVAPLEFFGAENLRRIEQRLGPELEALGYARTGGAHA